MVSGLIAAIPGKYINAIESRRGLTDMRYNRLSVNLFTPRNHVDSKNEKVLAAIAINTSSGFMGVLVAYLLSLTGRDHAVVKGAGAAAFAWMAVNGLLGSQVLKERNKDPKAPILSFIDHLINGGLCGFLVSKLGDDSLFPDTKKLAKNEKLPTMSMNNGSNQN